MKQKQYQQMNWAEIEAIIYSDCSHPFDILGPHKVGKETLIQAFFPYAQSVRVCLEDESKDVYEMEEVEEEGFFAVFLPNRKKLLYHFEVTTASGKIIRVEDPYAIPVSVSGKESVAFLQGVEDCANNLFTPKVTEMNDKSGVLFRVYAPNAVRVSVIGPFNRFDGRMNPMEKDDATGIFTLFVPGLPSDVEYCYEIKKKNGDVLIRRDPYALSYGESHPAACKVLSSSSYNWNDGNWLEQRKQFKISRCNISVYSLPAQILMQNNNQSLDKSCKELVMYLRKMHYSHVNIAGLWESTEKKPYPVKGFLAVSDKLAENDLLKKFIDLCHRNNIAVLADWPIAYFGNDEFGLAYFDGSHLYEHADARKGYHSFFDACLFQYKAPQVKSLLFTALRYLLEEYHFDGVNWIDVAAMLYLDYGKTSGEWICNEQGGNCNFEAVSLIREMNAYLDAYDQSLLSIACIDAVWSQVTKHSGEESLGFDFVENQGISDTLVSFVNTDAYGKRMAGREVIRQGNYAFCEGFMIPDKWSEKKSFGSLITEDDKSAAMNLLYAITTFYPGKKSKIYRPDDNMQTDNSVAEMIAMCNSVYETTPILYENDNEQNSMEFIDTNDSPASVLSFVRYALKREEHLLLVANASGDSFSNIRIAAPFAGKYKVFFTTEQDCKLTWNATEEIACNNKENSFAFDISPWSVNVFSYRPFTAAELEMIAEKKRKKRIQEIKAERVKIEKERDRIVADAIREATAKIDYLEKQLKELE